MKILITSGGTKIPIDRVRSITNMSTGNFGAKIGTEALKAGHTVVFMKAKGSKTPFSRTVDLHTSPPGKAFQVLKELQSLYEGHYNRYMEYEYSSFDSYAEELKFVIGVEQPDVIMLAAAVSDYGVENYFEGKLRSNDMLKIQLKQLPKLITQIQEWAPKARLIGFKLLVNSKVRDLVDAAQRSVNENHCYMVVANDLQDIKDNAHKLQLVFADKVIPYVTDPKDPNFLARKVVEHSTEGFK